MPAKCSICGFSRKDKYKVSHHMYQHLEGVDVETSKFILEEIENIKKTKESVEEFKCDTCGRELVSAPGLRYHKKYVNCSAKLDPTDFKPKMICDNIAKYGNTYADLHKILNACRDKMSEVAFNQNMLTLKNTGKLEKKKMRVDGVHDMKLRNFKDEDLTHCAKFPDFYVENLKKITDSNSCFSIMIRIYEIIFLNSEYKCNHNILVDSPEFGNTIKIYIRDQFCLTNGANFFEQILPHHLVELICLLCQNMLTIFYGYDDDEDGEYVFTSVEYLSIKTALLQFLKDNDLMYRLSRHLYYLTYRFHNPSLSYLESSEFDSYNPMVKITKPAGEVIHPEDMPMSLNLNDDSEVLELGE